MNLEQFVAILAMVAAIGTMVGSGFAAFFNNRKLAPIKEQMATVHTTAQSTAKDFAELNRRYENLNQKFHNFQLESSYQRGKQEAEIAHLKTQLADQSREIDTLKRQRDDLMRLLITERAKGELLNQRIKSLETERDATARKLAAAIASSVKASQAKDAQQITEKVA